VAILTECSCGKVLRAKDELAGKRVKCPSCSQVLTLPAKTVRASPSPVPSPPSTAPREIEVVSPSTTPESPPALPIVPPALPGLTGGTRVCEWCAESIAEAAVQCPHCHKWRRDIAAARRRLIVARGVGFASVCLVAPIVCFEGIWNMGGWFGNWGRSGPFGFSIWKFLTSPSGWCVILCAILSTWSASAARSAQITLRRKTGSEQGWFWWLKQ
jgi:hypothetical protein